MERTESEEGGLPKGVVVGEDVEEEGLAGSDSWPIRGGKG